MLDSIYCKKELLNILYGQCDSVRSLVELKNGQLLSASFFGVSVMKIWDMKKGGQLVKAIQGVGEISSLLLLKDGTIACYDAGDDSIHIWNLFSGDLVKSLVDVKVASGLGLRYSRMVQLSSGNLASFSKNCDNPNCIKIWNLQDEQVIQTIHFVNVECLLALPDECVAAGNRYDDHEIKIWNGHSGELVKTLIGHSCCVNVLLLVNETTMASGSSDQTIRIWDFVNGLEVRRLFQPFCSANVLSLYTKNILVSSNRDTINSKIQFWNWQTGELVRTLATGKSLLTMAYLEKSNCLVTAFRHDEINNGIAMWRVF
jgi:WD40 repeat protein